MPGALNSRKQVMLTYFRPQSSAHLHSLGPEVGATVDDINPAGSYRLHVLYYTNPPKLLVCKVMQEVNHQQYYPVLSPREGPCAYFSAQNKQAYTTQIIANPNLECPVRVPVCNCNRFTSIPYSTMWTQASILECANSKLTPRGTSKAFRRSRIREITRHAKMPQHTDYDGVAIQGVPNG